MRWPEREFVAVEGPAVCSVGPSVSCLGGRFRA